ncbi:four helix bundle protein [Alcanivorax sp. IL3]|uniref:four helix bundle protein n=1 Tax=unclassified Alcanivorax TaxID=2638842 RepID=UPI0039C1F4A1
MTRKHENMRVWQSAMALVEATYRVTQQFPRQEQFGLIRQMRRAAVSIPSNIAEGYGRGTEKERMRFLYIARGSLLELETQALIAQRLSYPGVETISPHSERVFAQLAALLKRFSVGDERASGVPRPPSGV